MSATIPSTRAFAPSVQARRETAEDLFVTLAPRPGETLLAMLARGADTVRSRGARIVGMTLFNGSTQREAAIRELPALFGDTAWPITCLESEGSPCDAPAGVELQAVRGDCDIRTIRRRDRVVGCAWEDSHARYCLLGDLRDEDVGRPPAEQASRVFEQMVDALAGAEMTFQHVYRTWFRNRNILDWYGEFNRVRTDFFKRQRVFEGGVLPASTGISAGNASGAALVAGLWAMAPKEPETRAFVVDSPLQDSACRYGSSFSRAVEVDRGGLRHLTISGTASIDRDGKTMHAGDIEAQVDQTMRTVRAILKARGMDWQEVVRGLVYYRHAKDLGAFARWAQAKHVRLPVLELHHTVCRSDLLYEIEVDACSGH